MGYDDAINVISRNKNAQKPPLNGSTERKHSSEPSHTHNHTYLLAAHSPLLPAALPSHPRREALGSARAPCAVQLHPTRDQRRSTRRLADTPYGIVEVSERPAAAEVAPGGFRCSARAGRTPAMISRACCAFVPLITPNCVPRRAQAVWPT